MTIGRKFAVSAFVMIVLCGLVGAVGWYGTSALGNRLEESISKTTRNLALAGELKSNVYAFRLQERGMLLFSYIHSAAQVDSCRVAFDKAMMDSFENIRQIRTLFSAEGGRAMLDRAQNGIEEYRTQQLEVRRLLAAGKIDEATEWDKQHVVPVGAGIVAAIDEFRQLQDSINTDAKRQAESTRSHAEMALAFGWLASMVTGVFVGLLIRRMALDLQQTAADLSETAGHLAGAAEHISSSSQSLAQGTSEQAASLEETSASTEELTSVTRKNVESATVVVTTVEESTRRFEVCNQLLNSMTQAMDDINASSGEVAKVVNVIDEISFQTGILALNAAVEAARAGESGLGFAVVADEVRSLAHRSAESAKESAGLIERSVAKSRDGKRRLDELAAALLKIAEQEAICKRAGEECRERSEEQSRGIEQIAATIRQISQVTQSSAAGAEENASTAQELHSQATALNEVVSNLRTMVGSAGAMGS